MTKSGKNTDREQLDRIEDALVEAILAASEEELRDDMKARGEDPDKCLARIEETIAAAKAACAKRRFDRAKSELKDWRAGKGNVVGFDHETARAKFEKIRARDPELASKMLMAARNGQGLSESDMEGMLEDLAKLERLDGEDGEKMTAVTAAERILMGLGISDPKEIDLEAIAWSRGALVEYRPLDGCDATIVGSSKKAVIAVNTRNSPERRRFSIGHEMGHWQHHRGRILFCGSKDVENPEDDALNPERHADTFASDLILPNYLLHPRLRKIRRMTLAAAREIRDEFAASLTATLLKIVQYNRFPLIVVCHNKRKRRWFRRADMVPGWWYPLEQLDRATFAADMLFNGAAEQNWPRKIPADAWFSFRNCDRFDIEEQSFMLPGEEVLTVLTIPEDGLG